MLAVITPTSLPADRHPAAVYLAGLAPASRRTMHRALDVIAGILEPGATAETLPWWEVRCQHAAAVRARLAETYSPATANLYLSALRGVLLALWRLGYISAEEHARAADLEGVRGSRLPAGRALSRTEVEALFGAAAADAGAAGSRDAAMLTVLYGCGLRRSEVVALDVDAWDPAEGALRVLGKGNKERVVYVASGRAHVERWLAVRGLEPGPLFLPVHRGGQMQQRRMTDQAVLDILRRRGVQAGLAHFSPHDLRRTFIGDLLDAGADMSAVQALAGHASVSTTARYDRRGERAKKTAAERLRVPSEVGQTEGARLQAGHGCLQGGDALLNALLVGRQVLVDQGAQHA